MQIIVNDSSCLIDLRKAGLLHVTLLLPFTFQIALPLIHSELADFNKAEIDDLIKRGLVVVDLLPNTVGRAFIFRSRYSALSFNDCMSMALAESQPGSILLTGDQSLRNQANALGIEVHGVFWISDQLESSGRITFADLLKGLLRLGSDPLVFVPKRELDNRIARLQKLLEGPRS